MKLKRKADLTPFGAAEKRPSLGWGRRLAAATCSGPLVLSAAWVSAMQRPRHHGDNLDVDAV